MLKQKFIPLLLCALLALLPCATFAQSHNATDASLRTTVYDPNGAVVVGAHVELLNEQGAVVAESLTDERGVATCAHVAAGKIILRVTAQGFEPQTVADLKLRGGANNR